MLVLWFSSHFFWCLATWKTILIASFRIQMYIQRKKSTSGPVFSLSACKENERSIKLYANTFFIWLNGKIKCRQNFKRHNPSPGHGKRTKESSRYRGKNSNELTMFPLPVSSVKLFLSASQLGFLCGCTIILRLLYSKILWCLYQQMVQ